MNARRLTDLYKLGKEIRFNDDEDEEPIIVWLRKLSPIEHEKALRRANSARVITMSQKDHPESEEFQSLLLDVAVLSREQKIASVIAEDVMKRRQARESELEFDEEEEWSKDGYLKGLKDAWDDGMSQRYAEDPEDPEAKKVFEELKRFNSTVDELMEQEEEVMAREFETNSDEDLNIKMAKKLVELEADSAWLREFRRCEIWLSVRTQDRKSYYFENREEVDELSIEIVNRLIEEYQGMITDPTVGKGLQAPQASSESYELPAPEETSAPSGQLVAVP